MAKARERTNGRISDNTATVGYEAQLWQMADALRGSMGVAEHKNGVLGLIFGVPPVGNARLAWVQSS